MPPTNHGTGGLPSLLHHLLRPEEDSRMLQQLSKIRGNVNIRFRGHKMTELEIPEDLQMRCAMLKSLLARPREIKSVPEEVQHIENGKHDIVQKVLGASRRYSDLVQQISVEENQVKEWEALQVQIEAAKERIKSLTTEKQAIEKGLQDIQERVAGFPVPSS
ncbi:hypothetical protein MMC18_002684 [Xylographa bjoerkii]|nr:hypothetical protein [Xylographa bjoerkii]